MGRNKCKVKNCENRRGTAKVSFFSFPLKDPERCRQWKTNCGIPEGMVVGRGAEVCADHFKAECFLRPDLRKTLTSRAIPTIFRSTRSARTPHRTGRDLPELNRWEELISLEEFEDDPSENISSAAADLMNSFAREIEELQAQQMESELPDKQPCTSTAAAGFINSYHPEIEELPAQQIEREHPDEQPCPSTAPADCIYSFHRESEKFPAQQMEHELPDEQPCTSGGKKKRQ